MGVGQPDAARPFLILQAIDSAASCSESELEMPVARLGSQSTSSQRRSAMSESAVVGSLVMLRSRLPARAS